MIHMKNKKIEEILYICFYVIFTIYWYFNYILVNSNIDFNIINKVLLVTGFISFVIPYCMQKYSKKEIIYQFLFISFLIFVYLMTGRKDQGILTLFPAIMGVRNIEIKKVTKSLLYTLITLSVILIILSIFRIIPYNIFVKYNSSGEHYVLELANQHGNPHYIVVFNIIALYLYTYLKKINLFKCFILQIIAVIAYYLFYSRTGIILSALAIWGIYISKKILNVKKISIKDTIESKLIFIVSSINTIFFLIIFLFAKYMNGTKIFEIINNIISYRIYEVNFYTSNYGIKLLPRVIDYIILCDNLQTIILINYGLLFTIVYLFIYYKAIKNLIYRKKYVEVFFIVLFMLYSYSEIVFLKVFCNFSILFLIYAFYPEKEGEIDNGIERR